MLTGAARAAERMGVRHLERVWVVTLPVVVVLILERIYFFIAIALFSGVGSWHWPCSRGSLVAPVEPWSVRTALVVTGFAVAAYALVWSGLALSEYMGEVRRTGRRLNLRGAAGRLFVLALLFVMTSYEMTIITSIPDRGEVMALARADFRTRQWDGFLDAVLNDVPGIREFCRENLDHSSQQNRLMAAAALRRWGEEDAATKAILSSVTRDEFLDERNSLFFGFSMRTLLQPNFGAWLPHRSLDPDKNWERYQREFVE